MKDPTNEVYEAIFSLLDGNVTISGTTIPVYSVMPDSVATGYVYIGTFTGNNADIKDRFMTDGNVTIQVVIPVGGASGSNKLINQYNSKVLELLKPTVTSTLDLSPLFNNVYFYSQNITDFTTLFDNDREMRKVTQLSLQIEEL
jgi:hypothetical protein